MPRMITSASVLLPSAALAWNYQLGDHAATNRPEKYSHAMLTTFLWLE